MQNFTESLKVLNGTLNGLVIIANAIKKPDESNWYDCYVDVIKYDDHLDFEENLKRYFINLTSNDEINKPENFSHHLEWEFKLNTSSNLKSTFQSFFLNLLYEFSTSQQIFICQKIYSQIENDFGDIEMVTQGYIKPPYYHCPYLLHWQNMMIKTQNTYLIFSFEANT